MANLLKIVYLSTKICIVYSRLNKLCRQMIPDPAIIPCGEALAVLINNKMRSPKTVGKSFGRPLPHYSILLSSCFLTLLLLRTTRFLCCLLFRCLFLCCHYFSPPSLRRWRAIQALLQESFLPAAINMWRWIVYTLLYIELSRQTFKMFQWLDMFAED